MLNLIKDSIVFTLKTHFPSYEVYTEAVKQGMETPCFFVFSLNPSIEPYPSGRYHRINPFTIQFVTDGDIREQYDAIFPELCSILEFIKVDGVMLQGMEMNMVSNDDSMSFFVQYDYFECRENDDDYETMEELEYKKEEI